MGHRRRRRGVLADCDVVDARVSGRPVRSAAAAATPDLAALGRLGASLLYDLLFAALPPAFAPITTALQPEHRNRPSSRRRRSPTLSRLFGAAQCWYDNSLRSYWCSWNVAASERSAWVQQLVSAVASCYQVQPEYDDDYDRETIAFGTLPGSASIYINGVGDSVSIFIGSDDHRASAP